MAKQPYLIVKMTIGLEELTEGNMPFLRDSEKRKSDKNVWRDPIYERGSTCVHSRKY